MKTIKYDKLVRDEIPKIIESSGKTCKTRVLSDEEYIIMLDKKLDEELLEYRKDKTAEELADLIEVIYALAKAQGVTVEQLESIRAKKCSERGAFDRKIFLESVNELSDL